MDSIEFYIIAHACGKVRIKESEGSIEERIGPVKENEYRGENSPVEENERWTRMGDHQG